MAIVLILILEGLTQAPGFRLFLHELFLHFKLYMNPSSAGCSAGALDLPPGTGQEARRKSEKNARDKAMPAIPKVM